MGLGKVCSNTVGGVMNAFQLSSANKQEELFRLPEKKGRKKKREKEPLQMPFQILVLLETEPPSPNGKQQNFHTHLSN